MKFRLSLAALTAFLFLGVGKPPFTGKIVMKVTTEHESLKEPLDETYYFYVSPEKTLVEIQEGKKDDPEQRKKYLINMVEHSITKLENDGGRFIGMRMGLPEPHELENKAFIIKKTDEQEEIKGYQCNKFVVSNDKFSYNVWTTEDLKVNFSLIFNALAYYKEKIKEFPGEGPLPPVEPGKGEEPMKREKPEVKNDKVKGEKEEIKLPQLSDINIGKCFLKVEGEEKNTKNKITAEVNEINEGQVPPDKFDITRYQIKIVDVPGMRPVMEAPKPGN